MNASADLLCPDVLFPALRRRESALVFEHGYVSSGNNRELLDGRARWDGSGIDVGINLRQTGMKWDKPGGG